MNEARLMVEANDWKLQAERLRKYNANENNLNAELHKENERLRAALDQALVELDAKRSEADQLRAKATENGYRAVAAEAAADRLAEDLDSDQTILANELERLRAKLGHVKSYAEASERKVTRMRKILDANGRDFQHERDKRRAVEAEVARLTDKLSFAELYLGNYKALYRSACVRARLYGDPTPLPERD